MNSKEVLAERVSQLIGQILEERRELLRKAWQEFETQIQQSLQQFLIHLRVDFRPEDQERIKELLSDLEMPVAPERKLEVLRTGIRAIKHETSQTRVITHLLNTLSKIVSRCALFVVKEGQLIGWDGRGFEDLSENDFKKIRFSLASDNIMRQALEREEIYKGPLPSGKDDLILIEKFIRDEPAEIMIVPMIIRGRPIGVIYCDEIPEKRKIRFPQEIEIMVDYATLMIEVLPSRTKRITTTAPKLTTAKVESVREPAKEPITSGFEKTKPGKTGPIELEVEEKELPPEEEALLHEVAKRRARVLVSDLILYHGEKIEEAKRSGNIYEKLKDEIELARMSYLRKVDPRVKKDYFYEELLNKVANGNPSLLKGYPVK